MSLFDELFSAQKNAMKAKDAETLSTLRMVLAAIKNAQIDADAELTDDDVQDVIRRQVKQLTDAKKDYVKGGRDDLVAQTDKEISVLAEYLPAQLSEEEVRTKLITLFEGKEDLQVGPAMGMAMKELKGVADGGMVKKLVSELLNP